MSAGSFLQGIAGGFATGKEAQDRHKMMKFLESQPQRTGPGDKASPASYHPDVSPGSGSGAGRSITTTTLPQTGALSDNARAAYSRLVKSGVSPVAASGIVGNLMQESGWNIDTGATGDGGTSGYSAQWHGPRLAAYQAWTKQNGADPTDLNAQIDYLMHEGQTTEKGAWDQILAAKTPQEAAKVASDQFWRPGDAHLGNRMAYAGDVYRQMYQPTNIARGQGAPAGRSIAPGMGVGTYMVQRYGTQGG